jgi:probable biosynthetic protein (TIGR04098 family)
MTSSCSASADGENDARERGVASASWRQRLGIPHLALSGISESWLLQYAGDVHWTLLSKHVGAPSNKWVDAVGNRLYASFVAVEMQGDLLWSATEGDLLQGYSTLLVVGGNRCASHHHLRLADGMRYAKVFLLSSFVRRDGTSNRAFVRAIPKYSLTRAGGSSETAVNLMAQRRELRLQAQTRAPIGESLRLTVCAMEDYNALQMIYFANFPRLLDRAERLHRFGPTGALTLNLAAPRMRRCFYYGNADGGDELTAEVHPSSTGSVTHLWRGDSLLCISTVART